MVLAQAVKKPHPVQHRRIRGQNDQFNCFGLEYFQCLIRTLQRQLVFVVEWVFRFL